MKKLQRSKDNKILGGVLGGIGEYFNIDPTLVRLLVLFIVALTFGTTAGPVIVAYCIAWLIVPEDNDRERKAEKPAPLPEEKKKKKPKKAKKRKRKK